MKIVSLTLENFRSYKAPVTISFNDLTVLIGKNDIGKSSVLEALDIFFENRKIDSDDINIEAKAIGETAKLTVVFSNLPDEIDLDAGAKTNLNDEYLLNAEGLLEIKKDFTSLAKPKTYILCNHPSNENANDLLSLKIKELQGRIKELKIDGDFKASVKNEIRKAIWQSFGASLTFTNTKLEISQEGVKLFLCLEGPTDIEFFNKVSPLFGIDLINDSRIVAVSLGGGTLGQCVTNNYIKKLNKQEVHIYDRDVDAKYQPFVDEGNNRGLDHFATLTQKREIENYFHESIVIPSFNTQDGFTIAITIDDHSDIPELIAEARHNQRNPANPWASQPSRYKEKCMGFVKKHLNTQTAGNMTIAVLQQRNAFDEVNNWFEQIKKRLN